ncbi:hypothetical protein LEP1GSC047_2746 [Leptospira inadai serovar Lyme str. 10]|uniref:Uncharacterized protein n=1 Tax=Leptospira inadai serovar Lyme str. 10 TaxID=1049790 RepID=V6HUB7_9LEPT|nr:hypothetical protein LEP1GSC047_2746 [Leptospira inadai serovar Lyme str. 10]
MEAVLQKQFHNTKYVYCQQSSQKAYVGTPTQNLERKRVSKKIELC